MTLKLIGAGLGRTGTLSLKLALEQLGFGRCYHMREVFEHPEAGDLWLDAARGRPDWERIFRGYSATLDYPGCNFWRELAAAYPDAKILLSVRDPDRWFESTRRTIFSEDMQRHCRAIPLADFFERTVFADFDGRFDDRGFMTDHFRRHVAQVQAAFPPERLLTYDVKEGWQPLCAFIGAEVPSTPFPRVNTSEEWEERRNATPDEHAAALSVQERAHDNGPRS
jgi:hypothetical protein